MSLGKYSPTVNKSYSANPFWHKDLRIVNSDFDQEGFDSYGYDCNDVDRAGNKENDYMLDENLYNSVEAEWRNIPVIGTDEYRKFIENKKHEWKEVLNSEKLNSLSFGEKLKIVNFLEKF